METAPNLYRGTFVFQLNVKQGNDLHAAAYLQNGEQSTIFQDPN